MNVYNTSNIQKPEVSDKSSQTTNNNSHLLHPITEPSSSARVETDDLSETSNYETLDTEDGSGAA